MTALILICAPLLLAALVLRECGQVLIAIDQANEGEGECEGQPEWLRDQIDIGAASDLVHSGANTNA